jgi:hypothetical protein
MIPGNVDFAYVGHGWEAYIALVRDLKDHRGYEIGNRIEPIGVAVQGDVRETVARHRAGA